MCRWLAYSGPRILLSSLILAPENSLIRQSRAALQGASSTNGDGFGIGWYACLTSAPLGHIEGFA
jgi:glutamine amidotransferase